MPAEEERLHLLQQLRAAPERADPARAAHLVARDREEVAVERLHVDVHVRRRLCGVAHEDRALPVRPARQRADVVDRPQCVRDEVRRHHLDRVVAGDRIQSREVDLAVVVEREHEELGALPVRDVLPWDEVGVVLELGDDDRVAGAEVVPAPRIGDEVECLGRVADEDDLPRLRGVQERAHLLAGSLEAGGRPLAEDVHGAVHVRVGRLVEGGHRIDHLARLLGAVRRIQVGEGLAVDQLLEDGEIGPQGTGVELLAVGTHSHDRMVRGTIKPSCSGLSFSRWRRQRRRRRPRSSDSRRSSRARFPAT